MITTLAGGVGASKFLEGLSQIIDREQLNIIVNTADDIWINGLLVSPDIDTIIYRLSGEVDRKRGWGLADDTFSCLETLERFGAESWFHIGDRDLATHIFRTEQLQGGATPSEITARIAKAYGLEDYINLLPMTDQSVETWIDTEQGEMHFQEYLVKEKMRPDVLGVNIRRIESADPAPGVISAIRNADAIILCPSNPIISIGPILATGSIRDELVNTSAKIIAISPLVGGVPLRGPADKLMRGLGVEVSSYGVASLYKDFLDLIVVDRSDAGEVSRIEELGIGAVCMDTVMRTAEVASELATKVLELFQD